VTTILARRAQVHQTMLADNMSVSNPVLSSTAAALASQLRRAGVDQPQLQAYRRIYGTVQAQASTLSYIDTFWMLGIATGIMFFLSFLLRKNNPRRSGASVVAH
jgi:MFS transporter, DHA2 family, multidrug resistance protein